MNWGVRFIYVLSGATAFIMVIISYVDFTNQDVVNTVITKSVIGQNVLVKEDIIGHVDKDHISQLDYVKPPDPDNWQTVIPDVMYVYSAYVNVWSTISTEIHILGALRQDYFRNPELLKSYCKIWIMRSDNVVMVEISKVVNVTSSFVRNTLLHSAEFICHFYISPSDLNDTIVSLLSDNNTTYNNAMILHNNIAKPVSYNFTVCLGRPLYGTVSVNWLLEWLELNRLFGADKILLHNDSFSSSLDPYIDYYRRIGLVRLLPWHFPGHYPDIDPETLSYYLQQTMLTDCLYRHQRITKYLVVCDLDELIVPRHPSDYTWDQMISRTGCSERVNGYGARHMLFSEEYERQSRSSKEGNRRERVMLDMTTRTSIVSKYYKRAKYIANTFFTTALSIHNIANGVGDEECVLSVDVAGLHHYRKTIPSSRFKVNQRNPLVIDKTLHKYGEPLGQSLTKIRRSINVDNEKLSNNFTRLL